MEEQQNNREGSSLITSQEPKADEAILSKEVAPKRSFNKKLVLILLGGFIVAMVGICLLVAYLVISSNQKPGGTIKDPLVTTTPTQDPKLTITPITESNYLYYIEDGLVYKRDLQTKESELLPIGEVEWGSESSLAGVTYPLISKDQNKLAFIPEVGEVSIYYFQDGTTKNAVIPKPTKGTVETYISGFNITSTKLLIYLDCVYPMDEEPVGFEYCPQEFIDQNVGLYVYDLGTGTTSKVTTQNNAWQSYNNLIGWVAYDADKLVVTKDDYENNSLKQTQIFEIDTKTGTHTLLENISDGVQAFDVWDFDKQGRMLYREYDGSKWSLYFDGDLIVEEPGYTSMQHPYLFNAGSTLVTYYSNTFTTINFKVVDMDGNLRGSKFMEFGEGYPISYKVLNQYLLEYQYDNGVKIYDISDVSNIKPVDSIDGNIRIIGLKG
jgi:hypothetical protein